MKTLAVEAEQKQDAVKKVVRAFSVTGCDFLQTDPPGPLSETTTVEIRPESLIRQAFLKAQAAANAARAILVDTTTYEGLGGLTGALEAHGKRVLEELGADAEVAEPVFRALVKSDSIATVRRPCDLRTLVVLAGQKQEAVENVIRAFSATGCDFLQTDPPGPLTKTTTVEIRHESLIRQWPRLKEWAGKEATERTNYAELAHDAIKWRTAHGAIRRGLEEEALAWGRVPIPSAAWAAHSGMELPSANHTDVKAYLAAARRRRKRIRNINRILVVSVAGLVSLLAVSTAGLTNIEAHFGNASAQDRMGDSSLAKKEAGAFYWYNKAAVQGDLHGEYMVGYMSYYGTYIDKNNTVAFAMLSQAVKNTPQDNDDWSQANFLLGEMFESAGGPQHELAAVAYYSTAAAGPYPSQQATYHLGEVYQNGINGVKIDMKKALDLYAKDAALGDPLGAQRIGDINQTEKNYLRAMAAYQQALKLATDAVKADSTDSFDATSAAYIDKAMGDLYNTGETGPAPAALQRANAAYADGINYAFKSLQMNPTDPDAQNIDVSLLGNEAWNEIEQGQFKLALQDANQSVSVASRVGSAATSCVTPNLIGGLPSCLVWTRTNVADSELLLGMIDQAKAIYENKDDMALNADGSGYSWKDDVRHDFKALTDGDNDNKTPPPLASVPPAERQEILQTIDAVKTAYASP